MCMSRGNRAIVFLAHFLGWMWLNINTSHGVQSDIDCLKGVRAALKDSNEYLSSWDFTNKTEGFICQFNGIECWHFDENKVLNVRLSNMGLRGSFPRAFKNCTSMTGLDLSGNELSGALPEEIGRIIPFVTSLDLSYNNFTGVIPTNLSNCSYLNILRLQHNGFSGQIPWQLGRLERLSDFDVADNSLSGPIPVFHKDMSEARFANNAGLCGKLLPACRGPPKKSHTGVIVGAAIGGITLAVIVLGAIRLFTFRKAVKTKKKKEEDLEGNKWAKNIKGTKGIKISMLENSVPKMRLFNLMKATDNFSNKNVVGSGRSGTMYRATLPNGTLLAVRRLEESHHSDSRFISEMKTLGRIKHSSLVPLLGFCIARKERLLIYKYMANGSLYQALHQRPEGEPKFTEWPWRLAIAVGTARALAWLHHCCRPCIILRNLSSKRILLDDGYEPKISDFGFAKFMNGTEWSSSTGRFCNSGLVAPESMQELVSTPKADVYSFGILMLELITGKEAVQVTEALRNFYGNVADWIGHLSNYYAIDHESETGRSWYGEMVKFLTIAFSCIAVTPDERPTMMEVYHLLRAIHAHDHGYTNEDQVLMSHVRIDVD
ncbi:hypothetical protein ACLOJK_011664 [Asimina triloba]